MKIQIFAVHDSKAHSYLQPWFMHNDEMAIRSFTQAVKNPDTNFSQAPLDYTLFHIGTYDDETSIITSNCPPKMLLSASQITIPTLAVTTEDLLNKESKL